MATLAVGRVCMKIAGREAGKYCVVLKKENENFYLVTGPKVLTGVKRRRCNQDHLEPTSNSLKIKAEASDKEVIAAFDKEGLLKKLGLKKPSPEVVKESAKKKKEKPKKEKKKEKPKKEEKKDKKDKKKEKPKETKKKASKK